MSDELQEVAIDRALGLRGSLYDFVKMAWPVVEPGIPFLDNWHIEEVCNHLEAVHRGEIKRLVINIPPGGMKSRLVSVFWQAWIWIRTPGFRAIFASYDGNLVFRDAKDTLTLIRTQWFQERWGDRFAVAKSVAISDHKNNLSGWRYCTSVKGPVTGRHADLIVVDDPLKPKDVTKLGLADAKNWWKGTLASRLRDLSTGRKVIIMQRLHDEDLAGYVINNEGHENWVHLRLPMRYEAKYPCKTLWGGDRRTEEGDLLWPKRFPEAELFALETTLGPQATAAQMQQRPAPEGGAIFLREWFKHYDVVPDDLDEVIQSWDCTFKGLDTSDYVVGQVWGRKGGSYYLLDQVRARMSFTATVAAIRSMSRRYPKAVTKIIEAKANGDAVIDSLTQGVPGVEEGLSGLVPVEPEGGKIARAHAVTGLFKAGNVFHPNPQTCTWCDSHREELASFPTGANDDVVDACSQALTYLLNQADDFAEAMNQLRKARGWS